MVLQRLTDRDEGDSYLQVLLAEGAVYEVEQRAGTTGERQWTGSASRREVRDVVLRWVADQSSR
ncbi:hypothetical protein SNE510_05910 [Streptomyces sp. NE5-10]|nr:hypothetical protein SNE510_05910 [Streptomyces sp. NE5-10]